MLTLLINQENANFYFVSPYRLTLKKKQTLGLAVLGLAKVRREEGYRHTHGGANCQSSSEGSVKIYSKNPNKVLIL